MSPESPCLGAAVLSFGREETEFRGKIIEMHNKWKALYQEHGDQTHELEVRQHDKVPFHSGYMTESTALHVPYSFTGEGQDLPIYQFDAATGEYRRMKEECEDLVKASTLVFSSAKA